MAKLYVQLIWGNYCNYLPPCFLGKFFLECESRRFCFRDSVLLFVRARGNWRDIRASGCAPSSLNVYAIATPLPLAVKLKSLQIACSVALDRQQELLGWMFSVCIYLTDVYTCTRLGVFTFLLIYACLCFIYACCSWITE